MKLLYDETYASQDATKSSRNLWYGNVNVYEEGQYGQTLRLDQSLLIELVDIINADLAGKAKCTPDETNWYFYELDTLDESAYPALMVRFRDGEFIASFNIRDYDFALNLDAILSFGKELELRLLESTPEKDML